MASTARKLQIDKRTARRDGCARALSQGLAAPRSPFSSTAPARRSRQRWPVTGMWPSLWLLAALTGESRTVHQCSAQRQAARTVAVYLDHITANRRPCDFVTFCSLQPRSWAPCKPRRPRPHLSVSPSRDLAPAALATSKDACSAAGHTASPEGCRGRFCPCCVECVITLLVPLLCWVCVIPLCSGRGHDPCWRQHSRARRRGGDHCALQQPSQHGSCP